MLLVLVTSNGEELWWYLLTGNKEAILPYFSTFCTCSFSIPIVYVTIKRHMIDCECRFFYLQ